MVMLSLPFAMIGCFGLLFITGETLSMTSLLGLLMLVGIVVNNGILFVDTANRLIFNYPVEEALARSGEIRLRPILMTTMTRHHGVRIPCWLLQKVKPKLRLLRRELQHQTSLNCSKERYIMPNLHRRKTA